MARKRATNAPFATRPRGSALPRSLVEMRGAPREVDSGARAHWLDGERHAAETRRGAVVLHRAEKGLAGVVVERRRGSALRHLEPTLDRVPRTYRAQPARDVWHLLRDVDAVVARRPRPGEARDVCDRVHLARQVFD